jgi:hypothetical protein
MKILPNPRDAAFDVQHNPTLWSGTDERFAGFGVLGLPFSSGHYLALRHMATSLGPGYGTVWHRTPDGQWTFIADAAPERSCARYFASEDSAKTLYSDVAITWDSTHSLRVSVPGLLDWQLELVSTPATVLISTLGSRLPTAAWRNDALRRMIGRAAGPILRAGRLGLAGRTPNGQRFTAAPRLVWAVSSSTAVLRGVDLGSPRPLDRQSHLGDFALPQRGLFVVANAAFENFDPSRHHRVHDGHGMADDVLQHYS